MSDEADERFERNERRFRSDVRREILKFLRTAPDKEVLVFLNNFAADWAVNGAESALRFVQGRGSSATVSDAAQRAIVRDVGHIEYQIVDTLPSLPVK
jgi:hypothetical protein